MHKCIVKHNAFQNALHRLFDRVAYILKNFTPPHPGMPVFTWRCKIHCDLHASLFSSNTVLHWLINERVDEDRCSAKAIGCCEIVVDLAKFFVVHLNVIRAIVKRLGLQRCTNLNVVIKTLVVFKNSDIGAHVGIWLP